MAVYARRAKATYASPYQLPVLLLQVWQRLYWPIPCCWFSYGSPPISQGILSSSFADPFLNSSDPDTGRIGVELNAARGGICSNVSSHSFPHNAHLPKCFLMLRHQFPIHFLQNLLIPVPEHLIEPPQGRPFGQRGSVPDPPSECSGRRRCDPSPSGATPSAPG